MESGSDPDLFQRQHTSVWLTCTQHRGPLGGGISLAGGLQFSTGQQPQLLLLLSLWSVLVGQLEQLSG